MGALTLALKHPTYESDFFAVQQLLAQLDLVEMDNGVTIHRIAKDTYTVTSAGGDSRTHVLQEYAIHHLLYCFYSCEDAKSKTT